MAQIMDDNGHIYDDQSQPPSLSEQETADAETSSEEPEGAGTDSDSPQGIARQEAQAGGGSGPGGINFKPDENAGGKRSGLRGRFGRSLKKRRRTAIWMGLGVLSLFPLVAIAVFIFGSLLIPDFTENMAALKFAKDARAQVQSVNQIEGEALANETASTGVKASIKSTYSKVRNNTWGKLDKWRPAKAIQSLQGNGKLTFLDKNGKTTTSVNSQTRTIVLNGEEIAVPQTTLKGNIIVSPINTIKQRLNFYKTLDQGLKAADPSLSTVIRSAAARRIIGNFGGSLQGYIVSKFVGKNDQQATEELQRETYNQVNDPSGIDGIASDEVKNVAENAKADMDGCVSDNNCLDALDNSGDTLSDKTVNDIQASFNGNTLASKLQSFIVGANKTYAIVAPLCMIYDGSRISSKTMDAQSDEQKRLATLMMSAGSQQQLGASAVNDALLGALNKKLGDIGLSDVVKQADNQPVNNTTGHLGTQQTAFGDYTEATLFDVALQGAPSVAKFFDKGADALCPILSNFWLGVGVGLSTLVANFVSAGATSAAQDAVGEAASVSIKAFMQQLTQRITTQFFTKKGIQDTATSVFAFARKFTKDSVRQGAVIAGATYLAQLLVVTDMGGLHNGLAQGLSAANDATDGADQLGNQIMQQQYMGAPLTTADVAQSDADDQGFRQSGNAALGPMQRYFALDNSASLASRLILNVGPHLNHGMFADMFSSFGNMLNPLGFGKLLSSITPRAAFAATVGSNTHYGTVQWGWTDAEYALINKNLSYQPLENQKTLDDSGKEDEISNKYSKCWTGTIGTLLADGDIQRDTNGNILPGANNGDCSPTNLGPHNPTYGDLVFRYRLAQNYSNTLDVLLGIQEGGGSGGQTS